MLALNRAPPEVPSLAVKGSPEVSSLALSRTADAPFLTLSRAPPEVPPSPQWLPPAVSPSPSHPHKRCQLLGHTRDALKHPLSPSQSHSPAAPPVLLFVLKPEAGTRHYRPQAASAALENHHQHNRGGWGPAPSPAAPKASPSAPKHQGTWQFQAPTRVPSMHISPLATSHPLWVSASLLLIGCFSPPTSIHILPS